MIIEIWYKIWCDQCNVINWICEHDTSEGFVCRQCRMSHSFSDDILKEMGIGIDPEDYDIGLERPT